MTKLVEPSVTDPAALVQVRSRQAGGHRHAGRRQHARDARDRQGRRGRRSTRAISRARWSSPSIRRVASDLKKQADDYRDKELFEFRPFNAARLRIVQGADTYEFQKVAGTGENPTDKWQRVNAGGSASDVDSTQDGRPAWQADEPARAVVRGTARDKTGLDKPELVVAVSYDQGKFERVRAAKPGADAFASRDGEPGAAKLDAAAYGDALKALTDLVTPPPSPLK